MTDHHPMLAELGQAADQALHNVRKMAMRRDSRQLIESYLGDCQACFLSATEDARRSDPGETVSDLSRAFRYARPNAELIGTLVVLATVSHHGPHDFRCLSLAVSARMRAELRATRKTSGWEWKWPCSPWNPWPLLSSRAFLPPKLKDFP